MPAGRTVVLVGAEHPHQLADDRVTLNGRDGGDAPASVIRP